MNQTKVLYRKLQVDELKALEHEFVKFLVVQGIEALDWEKIKIDSPEITETMLVSFSNMVFSDVLSRIRYLQKVEDDRIELIHAELTEWKMITIKWDAAKTPDLGKSPDLSVIEALIKREDTEIYAGKRAIDRPADQELFMYLEKNYKPSDGVLYTWLSDYLTV